MQYRQTQVIGKFEHALRALSTGPGNRLYAAGDSQVHVFDAAGKLERRWATAQPAHAIGLTQNGFVFAGEEGRVEIFDDSGHLANTWRDETRLRHITAIGFVSDFVLAADAKDRCIRRYHRSGKFLNDIGKDNRLNGFAIPNGILDFDVDHAGVIHAPNPGKHRIERYSCDGELLGSIGHFDGANPSGFGGCCNPTNMTLGPRGEIYTTEKAGPRAKVMDSNGHLLAVIATSAFHPACKNMDIAVDSRGHVFVADTVALRILRFEPEARA